MDFDTPLVFPASVVGGISTRNAASYPSPGLCLAPSPAVSREYVERCRMDFADALGIERGQMIFNNQVHGKQVAIARKGQAAQEADGLVSNTRGDMLCVSVADCAAVLLYDRETEAVAALHSGWRGTVANIAAAGVQAMFDLYGSEPQSLLAYIAACASGERYEVGPEVARQFPAEVVRDKGAGKFLLDIRARIATQLLEAGLATYNIEISEACTIGDERYHSYRRDAAASGRMAAFIGMV